MENMEELLETTYGHIWRNFVFKVKALLYLKGRVLVGFNTLDTIEPMDEICRLWITLKIENAVANNELPDWTYTVDLTYIAIEDIK